MVIIHSNDGKGDKGKGLKEGCVEGEKKAQLTIALEMKNAGVDIEQIAKFTKLDTTEIESLTSEALPK